MPVIQQGRVSLGPPKGDTISLRSRVKSEMGADEKYFKNEECLARAITKEEKVIGINPNALFVDFVFLLLL